MRTLDQSLFGWRVRSAIPLPDLLPWGGEAREPDITIVLGTVAPLETAFKQFGPAVQIGDSGVRVAIPDVATYWVEAGRHIIIDSHLPPDAPDIRVFLFGTILAVISFQRGRLPLHASVIEVDGKALVLCGDSGAGKSTMAAALVQRGFRIASDDLCLLDISESAPRIQPAFPRLRLWQQASTHLGIDTKGMEQTRATTEKHHIPVRSSSFHAESLPPALLVWMRFNTDSSAALTFARLRQSSAMRHYGLIHRSQLGLAMGRQALYFSALAKLVQHCPVLTLDRPRDFDRLDETADRLLALTRGEAAIPEEP